VTIAERYAQALTSARRAEELGFDSVAPGERHAGHFLSSGVTVLLGAIAACTSRVRIMTGVTVLSILDPLRVAEDYATIDQLSRGRVELVIGKGNEMRPFFNKPGNHTPGNDMTFQDIDAAIARGPVLVGSPQQVIDKIMWWHEAFGHSLQSFSLPTMIPHEQQREMLGRLATEVIPVVRKAAPDTLWGDGGPLRRTPRLRRPHRLRRRRGHRGHRRVALMSLRSGHLAGICDEWRPLRRCCTG
jgi:alkanesulfonate monooxygenase SsuD/methylene tetrahydromethanopterin reductase-like flavin-dependent oxidoreductase (luciferase family)